jgi:hypothetical protein
VDEPHGRAAAPRPRHPGVHHRQASVKTIAI